jgi:hypothetical protein
MKNWQIRKSHVISEWFSAHPRHGSQDLEIKHFSSLRQMNSARLSLAAKIRILRTEAPPLVSPYQTTLSLSQQNSASKARVGDYHSSISEEQRSGDATNIHSSPETVTATVCERIVPDPFKFNYMISRSKLEL